MLLPGLLLVGVTFAQDQFAGVTVGSRLDRDGWTCDAATCTRPGAIAGMNGDIQVSLCGDLVHKVMFSRAYVDPALPEGQTNLYLTFTPTRDPFRMADNDRKLYESKLIEVGYLQTSHNPSKQTSKGFWEQSWVYSDPVAARERQVRLTVGFDGTWKYGAAQISTVSSTACTSGL